MKKTIVNLMAMILYIGVAKAQTTPSFAQIAEKINKAEAQVIDARSAEEFQQSHIKGAVNINPTGADYQKDLKQLTGQKPIVIYSIGSGRSNSLAKVLNEKGFKDVWVLDGGFSKWIGSGYPIEDHTKQAAITTAAYNRLTQSAKVVLIDFGSKYCGSCKKLVPVLDSLENQKSFGAKIIKIESYEQARLVKEKNIKSLPTLLLYKDGKLVWQKVGQASTQEISAAVSQNKPAGAIASSK